MSVTSLRTLPYTLVRLPWTILDGALTARLPDDTPPKLALDRVLGTGDRLAGRLLRDEDLRNRGEQRLDRTGQVARAVRFEAEAAERRAQARDAGITAVEEAAQKRAAQQAEAGRAEAAEKQTAAEQAAADKQAAAKAARAAAARKRAAVKRAEQKFAATLVEATPADAGDLAVDQREHQSEAQAEATVHAAHRIHEAAHHDPSAD